MIYAGKRKVLGAYLGTTKVQMMMLGEAEVYADRITVSYNLNGISTTASSSVIRGSSFTAVLVADSGKMIAPASVAVTMGGVDVTDVAFDGTTYTISIPSATGNISITATAVDVIDFADDAVKVICVNNWGGGTISGEITKAEAAAVTNLASKFYGKTGITVFDELRYFTSLTSLYDRTSSGQQRGQFYNCTGLTKITLPAAPIANLGGAFRGCTALTSVDLSPITYAEETINCVDAFSISGSNITSIKMPSMWSCSSMQRCFPYNSQLVTLDFGVVDFSLCTSYANAFMQCSALTTVLGTLSGISQNIDLSPCPLTRESAMVFINGLASVTSTKTIKFSPTTYALLSADDIAIATSKNWSVNT